MKLGAHGSADFEGIALKSLQEDPHSAGKVDVAENLFRRLIKSGSTGEAFKTKAREHFKYSVVF